MCPNGLNNSVKDQLVRPPICAYSMEFPAGLIDEDEDPIAAGIRELKEETGTDRKYTIFDLVALVDKSLSYRLHGRESYPCIAPAVSITRKFN